MYFLYEYMSSDELEMAREDAKMKNEMLKMEHAYDVARIRHEIRLSNIEVDSLINEHTEDDLTAMYEHEMSIYMEETQSLWQKFKQWFTNVCDAIRGKNGEIVKKAREAADDIKNKEIELPFDMKEAKKLLDNVNNGLKKFIVPTDSDGKFKPEKLLSNIILVGGACASVDMISQSFEKLKKNVKVKVTDAANDVDAVDKAASEIQKTTNSMGDQANGAGEKGTETQNLIQKVSSTVVNWVKTACEQCRKVISSVFSKGDSENTEENPDGNNTPDENNGGEPEKKAKKGQASGTIDDIIKNGDGQARKQCAIAKNFIVKNKDKIEQYSRGSVKIDPAKITKGQIKQIEGMARKNTNDGKGSAIGADDQVKKALEYIVVHLIDDGTMTEAAFIELFESVDLFYYEYSDTESIDDNYLTEAELNIEDFINPVSNTTLSELSELAGLL